MARRKRARAKSGMLRKKSPAEPGEPGGSEKKRMKKKTSTSIPRRPPTNRKAKSPAGSLPQHDRDGILCRSPARLIVSYADGSWTDRLSGRRIGVAVAGGGVALTIEVSASGASGSAKTAKGHFGDFLRKRHRVESIQIVKRAIRKRLRALIPTMEVADFSVRLRAGGGEFTYPAAIAFDPDALTLNLG